MDPILPFIKEFKDNIIGITCFADYADDNRETSLEVKLRTTMFILLVRKML